MNRCPKHGYDNGAVPCFVCEMERADHKPRPSYVKCGKRNSAIDDIVTCDLPLGHVGEHRKELRWTL